MRALLLSALGWTLLAAIFAPQQAHAYAATPNYSCPSGGTLSGTTCTETIAATWNSGYYYCPSGGSLSGSTCYTSWSYGASWSPGYYYCPSGGSLSGSTCTTSSSYAATYSNYFGACPSGYPYQYDAYTCEGYVAPYGNGTCPAAYPTRVGAQCLGRASRQYSYSCPSGGTLSGSTCYTSSSYGASYASGYYYCPSGGYVSGSSCIVDSSYGASYQNGWYTCPGGYSLSGSTCVRTYTASVSSYSCPSGGVLSGTRCLPTAVSVSDGVAGDVAYDNTAPLDANWTASTGGTIQDYSWCFTTSSCAAGAVVSGTTASRVASSGGTGLSTGVTYLACVRAQDTTGDFGAWSCSNGVLFDAIAPAAITTLSVPSTTLSAPAMTWTTVGDTGSGTAYYRVYRGPSSTGPWTQVSTNGAPVTGAYTDATAPWGTSWYRVQAVDAATNEAATSNVVSTRYHRAPTITLVSPATSATGVSITPTLSARHDDADADVGSVAFELCSNATCSVIAASTTNPGVAAGATTNWNVSPALQPGTQYWWRARTTDSSGAVSAWSSIWTFTTVFGPTIIDNQAGDSTWRRINDGTYDIDFSDPTALDRFEVRTWSGAGQSGTMRQDWTLVTGGLSGTSYTLDWALPASTWSAMADGVNYVTVRVTNTNSNTATTVDAFTVSKDTLAPSDVTSTALSPTIVAPAVSWGAATDSTSGVAYYRVYRGASATGPWSQVSVEGSVTTTSFTDSAAPYGTFYYLVRAVDYAGLEATGGTASGAVVHHRAPTATLITPADAATNVALSPVVSARHDDADGNAGTIAFQICSDAACSSIARTGSSAAGIVPAATGSWTVTPALAVGTTYWWRARTTDTIGAASAWTTIRSFTTVNAPAITDNQPGDVAWRNSNSATYDVDFADGVALTSYSTNVWSSASQGGIERQAWTQVAMLSGTSYTTNWALLGSTWTTLAEGVNFVSVRARNSSGLDTTLVDAFEVRKDTAVPSAVTTLAASSPTLTAPALTWGTVTDATSGVAFYRVYRGTSSTGPWTLASTDGAVTTGSLTDVAAPVGQTSWYRVQARDQAGNEASASNIVSVIYHRVPDAPTPTTPANGATGVTPLPSLAATHVDPDGDAATVSFELCSNATCSIVPQSGTSPSTASGSSASWTAGSALAQGTQYWWRARSTDARGATSSWSAIWSFTTSTGPTITDNQAGDATWRNTDSGTYDVDFWDPLGLDRFEVQVWSGPGQTGTLRQGWTLVAGSLTGTTYATNWNLPASTWATLAEGVNYVSIRAVGTSGGTSTLADAFEVRKDLTATAPTAINDGAGADVDWWGSTSSFSGNWTASVGEAGMSGVQRYQYCISTAAACGGTVARTWTNGTGTPTISATALSLGNGQLYYLAIRMVDGAGNTSAPTSSDSFRVDATAPSAPTLVSPPNAATLTATPTLQATYVDAAPASAGQLSFQLCADSSCATVASSGSSAAALAPGTDGSWTPAVLVGGTYWWRATGTDAAGTPGASSPIRSFTITYPPTAPTPMSPADTAWVATATPTLSARFEDPDTGATGQLTFETCATSAADPWSGTCASGYQSGTSAAGVARGTNGSWTTAAVANGATRYWRVRGNDGTSAGPWSVVRSIRIDTAPPPAVTTLAAASPTTSAPALTWTSVTDTGSGTAYYRVYRSSSAGTLGTQVNVDGATTTGVWTESTGLSSGTWHYTVRAVDNVGNVQTIGNGQVSVSYTAPIYFRSSASAATAPPSSWLLSRVAGTAADTSTRPRIGRNQGCYVQFAAGTAPTAPACPTALPTIPSGGGWLLDASSGDTFAAGAWRVHLTTTAQRAHGGYLNVNAWKVTLVGGAIQPGAVRLTTTGWAEGSTNVGATTTETSSFVDVPMNAASFAAGEYLYVEVWERLAIESGNNSTSMTLQVNTVAERIHPTGPVPPMSVDSTTPSSLPQGRTGVAVQISGSGFVSGASVDFGSGITVTGTTWVSPTRIDATVTVGAGATLGTRNLVVTNPDLSSASGSAVFSVAAPSISVAMSTLGHGDGARDTTPPYEVAFGEVTSGSSVAIGPGTSGQVMPGAAIALDVTSDTDTIVQASSTDWSNGASGTLTAAQLAWKPYGSAQTWTAFGTTASTVEARFAPGTTPLRYDLQLSIPPGALAGDYSGMVSYAVLPAP